MFQENNRSHFGKVLISKTHKDKTCEQITSNEKRDKTLNEESSMQDCNENY